MINGIAFTGRETMLTPKTVKKSVEEAAGFFNYCAPHGVEKAAPKKIEKAISAAEQSWVDSHSVIESLATESSVKGENIQFFG